MAFLKGTSVTKRFGGVVALDKVEFEVQEGEVLGLIGPNGSGKTTLLNVISGLAPATNGRIEYGGVDITRMAPEDIAKRGIARTFQIVRPFKGMTVLENVAVGALFGRNSSFKMSDALAKADEVLETVGLSGRRVAAVTELSLAQRKRLEVARAMAMEPRLLLLDEVMAGLNSAEVDATIELLRRINQYGVTIIVIEHVMKAVMGLSNRVMVLHNGKNLTVGSPQEVVANKEVIGAYLGERYAKTYTGPVC